MKQLLLSAYCVDFNGYHQLLEILEALDFAKVGAELSMFSKTSMFPNFMNELAQWKERFAPYYIDFHGPFKELEATSPLDSDAHRIMIEAYRDAFDTYKEFNAQSIVMHTNQRIKLSEDNTQLRENAIATILEIAGMARERKVNLCVENVGRPDFENVLFPMEDFIQLFDRLPEDVNCLIDVGHAFLNRWDLEYVIKKLGRRITAYHLHNNNGLVDSHRPMFEPGGYYQDWSRLFSTTETYSPDADWILEYAPGDHITTDLIVGEVRQVLDFL